MRRDHVANGFTLVSLLSTMAISSILLGIGIPSIMNVIQTNKLSAEVASLQSHLTYARSVSIEQNDDTIACKSADQQTCTTSGDWSQGWIVFRDTNKDMVRNADEPVLVAHGEVQAGLVINYRGFGFHHGVPLDFVVFRGIGTTSTNGTFTFCEAQKTVTSRTMTINRMGRIRLDDRSIPC